MSHVTNPSAPGRILITGSRSYDDARRMRDAIDAAVELPRWLNDARLRG